MVCLNCVRVKTPEVYIFGIQKYLLSNLCLLFTSLLDLKSCSSFFCFLTFLLLLLALYCPGPGGAPLPHTPMLLLSVSESFFFLLSSVLLVLFLTDVLEYLISLFKVP